MSILCNVKNEKEIYGEITIQHRLVACAMRRQQGTNLLRQSQVCHYVIIIENHSPSFIFRFILIPCIWPVLNNSHDQVGTINSSYIWPVLNILYNQVVFLLPVSLLLDYAGFVVQIRTSTANKQAWSDKNVYSKKEICNLDQKLIYGKSSRGRACFCFQQNKNHKQRGD